MSRFSVPSLVLDTKFVQHNEQSCSPHTLDEEYPSRSPSSLTSCLPFSYIFSCFRSKDRRPSVMTISNPTLGGSRFANSAYSPISPVAVSSPPLQHDTTPQFLKPFKALIPGLRAGSQIEFEPVEKNVSKEHFSKRLTKKISSRSLGHSKPSGYSEKDMPEMPMPCRIKNGGMGVGHTRIAVKPSRKQEVTEFENQS